MPAILALILLLSGCASMCPDGYDGNCADITIPIPVQWDLA